MYREAYWDKQKGYIPANLDMKVPEIRPPKAPDYSWKKVVNSITKAREKSKTRYADVLGKTIRFDFDEVLNDVWWIEETDGFRICMWRMNGPVADADFDWTRSGSTRFYVSGDDLYLALTRVGTPSETNRLLLKLNEFADGEYELVVECREDEYYGRERMEIRAEPDEINSRVVGVDWKLLRSGIGGHSMFRLEWTDKVLWVVEATSIERMFGVGLLDLSVIYSHNEDLYEEPYED